MGTGYFVRAGRAGRGDLQERMPELRPLASKTVLVVGLGCVGGPSAQHLAKAAVGRLRVVDHDIVDPATIGRWPFGLSAAGFYKAHVIAHSVARDYPFTEVEGFVHRLGGIRGDLAAPSDLEMMETLTSKVSLIYDATAEIGCQHFLSDYAKLIGVPYLCVTGSFGGWGGTVVTVRPGRSQGCWLCYRHALDDGTIPSPPSSPEGNVQPRGCANPTFTGSGFDLAEVALVGVRAAVSVLCDGQAGAYPDVQWDVLTVAFRDSTGGLVPPLSHAFPLDVHPRCRRCNP